MEIDISTLSVIISLAAVLLAVYIFLYYKFIYSVIDPLFVWVLTTSFASVLAIEVIPDLKDVLHFFGCQLFLWLGFLIAYRKSFIHNEIPWHLNKKYTFSDQSLLRLTTYILLWVYIISNIIIAYSKGFALFSDSPTESKIANFQQGFGLFRKINWSAGTFVSTSLVFMYFEKKRKIDLFLLGLVIILTSLEGSKSAFLQVAISAGIVFYHPAFSDRKILLKKFKRYLPLVFVGTMGIFFTVLMKENDGINLAFYAFIKRLLYSADSVLYYYQPVNIDFFSNYSFSDYIYRIINPILGFFRLQEYLEAPGNIMVDNLRLPGSIATVTVGPNAPFYIEGRIYFNYWAAFPYSMLVGYLYATLRTYFFSINRSSAFFFVYMGSFLHLGGAIIIDINLAVTQSFDLVFFVGLPYVIISLLVTGKLTIKLNSGLLKLYSRN